MYGETTRELSVCFRLFSFSSTCSPLTCVWRSFIFINKTSDQGYARHVNRFVGAKPGDRRRKTCKQLSDGGSGSKTKPEVRLEPVVGNAVSSA